MRCAGEERGGFVLVYVLLAMVLVAVLTLTLLQISRARSGLAGLTRDEAVLEGALAGGVEAVGFMLFQAQRPTAAIAGTRLTLGGAEVELSVVDEGGLVDLNGADARLIEGLYRAAGGTGLAPAVFAARVLDWRDLDEAEGQGGAEADAYRVAGRGGPRNGPFLSREELLQVLGVTPADYLRLVSFVTVDNAEGTIDVLSAPPMVLRALPTLTESELERILALRSREGLEAFERIRVLLGERASLVRQTPGPAFRVRVHARLGNGAARSAEAVLAPSDEETRPFVILEWSMVPPPQRR